jgi:hypothetical protein
MSVNPQTRIGARFHRAQRPADPCLGSSVDQTNPNSNQPEPNEATRTFCQTNPTPPVPPPVSADGVSSRTFCETNPIACVAACRTSRHDPGDRPFSMMQTGITKRSQSRPSGAGSARVTGVFGFDQTNPNSSQPEPNETTCTFCETNPTHLYRRRSLPAAPLAGRLCETNPIACATAHRTKRDPGDQPPSMIQTGITKRSQSHPSGGGSTRVIRVFRFDETNPISPETTQDKWAEEHLGRGRPLR